MISSACAITFLCTCGRNAAPGSPRCHHQKRLSPQDLNEEFTMAVSILLEQGQATEMSQDDTICRAIPPY